MTVNSPTNPTLSSLAPDVEGLNSADNFSISNVKVTLKEGNRVREVTPVAWDGLSEMLPGVTYYLTPDQAEVFTADKPHLAKKRNTWKSRYSDQKIKVSPQTSLAGVNVCGNGLTAMVFPTCNGAYSVSCETISYDVNVTGNKRYQHYIEWYRGALYNYVDTTATNYTFGMAIYDEYSAYGVYGDAWVRVLGTSTQCYETDWCSP